MKKETTTIKYIYKHIILKLQKIKYKENNPGRDQRGKKNLDNRGTKSSDLHVTSIKKLCNGRKTNKQKNYANKNKVKYLKKKATT